MWSQSGLPILLIYTSILVEKGEGKNRYAVIGMMEGFDMAKSLKENDDFDNVWDRNEDFFGQVVE